MEAVCEMAKLNVALVRTFNTKALARRCSVRKVILEISQYLQENI